jgi:hypothetical protein
MKPIFRPQPAKIGLEPALVIDNRRRVMRPLLGSRMQAMQ